VPDASDSGQSPLVERLRQSRTLHRQLLLSLQSAAWCPLPSTRKRSYHGQRIARLAHLDEFRNSCSNASLRRRAASCSSRFNRSQSAARVAASVSPSEEMGALPVLWWVLLLLCWLLCTSLTSASLPPSSLETRLPSDPQHLKPQQRAQLRSLCAQGSAATDSMRALVLLLRMMVREL